MTILGGKFATAVEPGRPSDHKNGSRKHKIYRRRRISQEDIFSVNYDAADL